MMEYFEVLEHSHFGGIDKDGKPMVYAHPCQRSLGHKSCPECDKYFRELERLKLAGGKDTVQGKEINKAVQMLKIKKKGWVYYVTPDSNEVKAFKMPESLINLLWGRPQRGNWEEIPSLIAQMKQMSMSPYDLRGSTVGWLSLYKTGEKLGTKYHATIAARDEPEIVNGRPMGMRKVFVNAEVSDFVLNSYDVKMLPDFREIEKGNAFTMEESEEFAKNPFITPQRIIDKFKKEAKKVNDADEAGDVQSTSVESVMASISAASAQLDDIDSQL
jgi:hypothetical protein